MNTLRGAIYGLSASAIWGGMFVVADVILETIPPFTLLTLRYILGVALLAIIIWQTGTQLPARRDTLRLFGVGLIGFGVGIGLQFVGTAKSTAVNGALITTSSPAFILIFAALILGETLTLRHIGAVLLATAGVVVIVNPAQANFSSETFTGDLLLALSALLWGLYSVLVRQAQQRDTQTGTLAVTLFTILGGLLLAIPVAVVELVVQPVGTIDGGVIAGVLYLGLISTALAMWLWNRAFALVDASVAALFFFAQPLVGALLGVIFLGQRMTLNLWAGSALIVVGVLLSFTISSPHTHDS